MADSWERIDWFGWERTIRRNGIAIDRPKGSRHPEHPEIVYPLDYGYVKGTKGGDGEEVDVFAGSTDSGLVGAIVAFDPSKRETEIKLLWNMDGKDVEAADRFVNGVLGMKGRLILPGK
jgi:inorganic pyrophosphatase